MNNKKIRKVISTILLILLFGYVFYDTFLSQSAGEPAPQTETAATGTPTCPETPREKSSTEDFALPRIKDSDIILRYTAFTVNYNSEALIPKWVAYELQESETDGEATRSNTFRMDPSYKGRQAMREDYSNSGYDKGHMAPAADMKWDEDVMKESFFLTNVCPQEHSLNSRDWLTVEKMARNYANKCGKIWVVCGPIIGKNKYGTIGENKVVVPDAFFKAFLVKDGKGYQSVAFVMNNNTEHHETAHYLKTVNEVEKLTGFDLFPLLDDALEETVEDTYNAGFWGIK